MLQMLVDERLGDAGPWHGLVDAWRSNDGVSWAVCAERLRGRVRLSAEDGLTGETLRRWSAQRDQIGGTRSA